MAKSEMGTVLTLGLVGAGIYFAWPYISQLLGSIGAPPTAPTIPPTTPPSTPASPASCATLSFTCPDGTVLQQVGQGPNCLAPNPWNCPPPASNATLVSQLITAAPGFYNPTGGSIAANGTPGPAQWPGTYSVSEWNYILANGVRSGQPLSDLVSGAFGLNQQIDAATYVAARLNAGLSGLGRRFGVHRGRNLRPLMQGGYVRLGTPMRIR